MGAEKQCFQPNNSEVQERRNDLNDGKKTEDQSVTTRQLGEENTERRE